MHVIRKFNRVRFPIQLIERGVKELEERGQGRPSVIGSSYTVSIGPDSWTFDNIDEWYAAYDQDDCPSAHLWFQAGADERLILDWDASPSLGGTSIQVQAVSRPEIERVMRIFSNAAPDHLMEDNEPKEEPERPVVFIGHGHSRDWRDLKDELQDKHGYEVVAYETGARAGHTIRDVLSGMLRASNFALLVMSAEDETSGGGWRARQNVVHEAGIFQGVLGFHRAIAIVEEGVEVFSNLDGVQHIPYPPGQIKNTMSEILATLHREFMGRR